MPSQGPLTDCLMRPSRTASVLTLSRGLARLRTSLDSRTPTASTVSARTGLGRRRSKRKATDAGADQPYGKLREMRGHASMALRPRRGAERPSAVGAAQARSAHRRTHAAGSPPWFATSRWRDAETARQVMVQPAARGGPTDDGSARAPAPLQHHRTAVCEQARCASSEVAQATTKARAPRRLCGRRSV
jgi:hypothetical protein